MTEETVLQFVDQFRDMTAKVDWEKFRIWQGFQQGTEVERNLLIRYLSRRNVPVEDICRIVGFQYPKQRQLVYDAKDNPSIKWKKAELELGLATKEELGFTDLGF